MPLCNLGKREETPLLSEEKASSGGDASKVTGSLVGMPAGIVSDLSGSTSSKPARVGNTTGKGWTHSQVAHSPDVDEVDSGSESSMYEKGCNHNQCLCGYLKVQV